MCSYKQPLYTYTPLDPDTLGPSQLVSFSWKQTAAEASTTFDYKSGLHGSVYFQVSELPCDFTSFRGLNMESSRSLCLKDYRSLCGHRIRTVPALAEVRAVFKTTMHSDRSSVIFGRFFIFCGSFRGTSMCFHESFHVLPPWKWWNINIPWKLQSKTKECPRPSACDTCYRFEGFVSRVSRKKTQLVGLELFVDNFRIPNTTWFKLNALNFVGHERRLLYLLECHILGIAPTVNSGRG